MSDENQPHDSATERISLRQADGIPAVAGAGGVSRTGRRGSFDLFVKWTQPDAQFV
jgi:hypothetical protein